jgi:hypothetical protein
MEKNIVSHNICKYSQWGNFKTITETKDCWSKLTLVEGSSPTEFVLQADFAGPLHR